jgi:hypothetical protein
VLLGLGILASFGIVDAHHVWIGDGRYDQKEHQDNKKDVYQGIGEYLGLLFVFFA